VVSLVAELRGHERPAAEDLGQWSEKREVPGDAAAPQTAITVRFVRPVGRAAE
jgi:hypothetical protein